MIIVTSGKKYLDIDGFACAVAYRELFKLRGIEACFVSYAELNASITPSLRALKYDVDNYEPKGVDEYIILDLQNPEYIPDFVPHTKIIEIVDHHSGFIEYWKELLGENAVIEKVGAAATLIYEKYVKYHLEDKITEGIAKLLCAAILDNTHNFTIDMDTSRDKAAYDKLLPKTHDKDFREHYFKECQLQIESNIEESIYDDLKLVNFPLLEAIGQLTLWDASTILKDISSLKKIINNYAKSWVLVVSSIKSNTSYLLYANDAIKDYFEIYYSTKSKSDIITINKVISRYDIIQIFKN